MESIVALVEGHLETHFINLTFQNPIVMRPFPNGRDVSADLIIEAIEERLETIDGTLKRVLILFDRENRNETAASLAQKVRNALQKYSVSRSIYIGVADRMAENWIVADVGRMRIEFGDLDYSYEGDGTNGKSTLRKLNGGQDAGFRDKAALLKRCSAQTAANNSPSLHDFLQQIDFHWFWANR
jgi:hypothetical protein